MKPAPKPTPHDAGRRPVHLNTTQYFQYFAVGVFVGLATVAVREVIAALLPSDTPIFYSISIIVVYAFGVGLSFQMQLRITFGGAKANQPNLQRVSRFITVAIGGALATSLLALALRYGLGFDGIFGRYSPTAAFIIAAVATSGITYAVNALLVFAPSSPPLAASPQSASQLPEQYRSHAHAIRRKPH